MYSQTLSTFLIFMYIHWVLEINYKYAAYLCTFIVKFMRIAYVTSTTTYLGTYLKFVITSALNKRGRSYNILTDYIYFY